MVLTTWIFWNKMLSLIKTDLLLFLCVFFCKELLLEWTILSTDLSLHVWWVILQKNMDMKTFYQVFHCNLTDWNIWGRGDCHTRRKAECGTIKSSNVSNSNRGRGKKSRIQLILFNSFVFVMIFLFFYFYRFWMYVKI